MFKLLFVALATALIGCGSGTSMDDCQKPSGAWKITYDFSGGTCIPMRTDDEYIGVAPPGCVLSKDRFDGSTCTLDQTFTCGDGEFRWVGSEVSPGVIKGRVTAEGHPCIGYYDITATKL